MSDEIIRHYTETYDEDARLGNRIGPLEYERTTDLITRYLSRQKQIIVDVGGGTGAYTLWLAEQGHEVRASTEWAIEAASKFLIITFGRRTVISKY